MTYRQSPSNEAAVRASLTAKPPAASDRAVAQLALTLARSLDGSGPDPKTAAALLAALEALQMSPRARAAAHRGEVKDVPAVANPLDQLAVRRAGRGRTPAVDTTAP